MKRSLYVLLLLACAMVTFAQAGKGSKRTPKPSRARISQVAVASLRTPAAAQVQPAPLQAPVKTDVVPAVKSVGITPSMSGFDWFFSQPGENVGSGAWNEATPRVVDSALVSPLEGNQALNEVQTVRQQLTQLKSDFANETDPEMKVRLAEREHLLQQHISALEDQAGLRQNFLQRNKKKLLALAATVAVLGYAGHRMHRKSIEAANTAKNNQATGVTQAPVTVTTGEQPSASPSEGEGFLKLSVEEQKKFLASFSIRGKKGLFLNFVENVTTALENKKKSLGTQSGPLLDSEVASILVKKISFYRFFSRDKRCTTLLDRLKAVLGIKSTDAPSISPQATNSMTPSSNPTTTTTTLQASPTEASSNSSNTTTSKVDNQADTGLAQIKNDESETHKETVVQSLKGLLGRAGAALSSSAASALQGLKTPIQITPVSLPVQTTNLTVIPKFHNKKGVNSDLDDTGSLLDPATRGVLSSKDQSMNDDRGIELSSYGIVADNSNENPSKNKPATKNSSFKKVITFSGQHSQQKRSSAAITAGKDLENSLDSNDAF